MTTESDANHRDRLAAMGQLIAALAHELSNPLSVVLARTALLREQVEDGPLAADLDKIMEAVERCARIVQSFLSLARQRPTERLPVGLAMIVDEALELMATALELDGVEVVNDVPADLPLVWADPDQLHQVVVNLVANAQQAMREAPPPRRLTLSARAVVSRYHTVVQLDVADTGHGIAPEIRARILEPFFTTRPLGGGTGLGLALCRAIVEGHGGALTVESEPGHGAVFTVELPTCKSSTPAYTDATAPAVPGVSGKAILIVEDEPEVAEVLVRALSRLGHRVSTAANGNEALARLAGVQWDLIVSDLKMPELDGPGFYHEVRSRYPVLKDRFVFLTGDTLSASTAAFLESHALPRIEKPVAIAELRRVVQEALDRAR